MSKYSELIIGFSRGVRVDGTISTEICLINWEVCRLFRQKGSFPLTKEEWEQIGKTMQWK